MIGPMLLLTLSLAVPTGLPEPIRKVLEAQLPIWSQVTGNPAPASTATERIAVERTSGNLIHLFLIDRKLQATVTREDDRHWLTEVVWCGEAAGRCEDLWKRNDEQWRSDKNTANHTGFAVYRDSLGLAAATMTESVPALATGKKKWDKGLCEAGLCFVVSSKDSSVARAAVRPDGSVLWWDGGYILGGSLEKELVHGYKYLLEKGKPVGSR